MEKQLALVTGASGFLGLHVLARARIKNYEALPLVREQYDLCHESEAALAFLGARPSHAIHTAFQWAASGAAFRNNMAIGMNVVHSAAVNHTRIVLPQIYYGPLPWERDSGVDVGAGCDAQDSLERMCEAYESQYDLDCALVRLPTLYGAESPRPDPVSLVATALWKAAREGAPKCSLPFCSEDSFRLMYVGDAAEALVQIAFSAAEGPCRVTPLASVSVGEIIEQAVKALGYQGKIQLKKEPSPLMRTMLEDDDVHEFKLDNPTSVEVGLMETFRILEAKAGKAPEVKAPPAAAAPSKDSQPTKDSRPSRKTQPTGKL